ncbi:transglutaminase-like cysteine peptidase [Vibrio parahaemolyticus]|uniref:transglutaminase-like cysteine peptidase n=1 Tax=Vibrio parahaemolyticus TaxID=670 RepID=UPI0015DEED3F|nr:transglutaminase-like cysteine peptidase [Vibrio parahaemolyticus]
MKRITMMLLCLLYAYGEAQARDVAWIKHRLLITHDFYNRIVYTQDMTLWGQKDYWATPEETLRRFKGDCEDIAIAKFFSLLRQGMPKERLRLVYLQLPSTYPKIYHLVLEYHHEDGQIYVLDNRYNNIHQADDEHHRQTVVSFDLQNMWIDKQRVGDSQARMKKWRALVARYRTQTAASLEKQRVRQLMPHLLE